MEAGEVPSPEEIREARERYQPNTPLQEAIAEAIKQGARNQRDLVGMLNRSPSTVSAAISRMKTSPKYQQLIKEWTK